MIGRKVVVEVNEWNESKVKNSIFLGFLDSRAFQRTSKAIVIGFNSVEIINTLRSQNITLESSLLKNC